MMKIPIALLALAAGVAIGMGPALAQDAPPAKKEAHKAPAKKKAAKKDAAVDEDDKEPDVSASATTEYHCDHGNTLTIYRNAEDDKHIALRWNKRLLRLNRVTTTTGANRFENSKNGWVWIDIPTKGMLLDSKKGRQLANECKSPEQMAPKSENNQQERLFV
jgi:membrane-bound inhibitor of C-type lysozyme